MAEPTSRGGARRAPRSIRLSARERRRLEHQQRRGGRRALSTDEVRAQRRAARRTGTSRKGAPAATPRAAVAAPAPTSLAATTATAATTTTPRTTRSAGGRRALRPGERRTRGLAGTLGMTFLGAVVPGSGYLYAGRKLIGGIVIAGWAIIAGFVAWYFGRDWRRGLDLVFDPQLLKIVLGVVVGLLLVWLFVVWTSYRLVRPRERPRWHTWVGNIAVVVFCGIMAAPVLRAAQYGMATAGFVERVFDNNETATAPDDVTHEDPWAGRERVNVLLLGGDGGEGREGVRTDSVILLSIDTRTGKTVTFSLPRNMANAQFPEGSPLREEYPYGFSNGDPASGDFMLNAIYRNIPAWHPGILGKSTNEGADAIKQAVEGTLGIPVEYYVLVNLDGFKQVVDAIGGVDVNINEPIAVQGCTDCGTPPDEWIPPGPDQHLNGYYALWFARGRVGSDDYERMERQRCMVDAIVEAADPANVLRRYLDLIKAGEEIVYTDIPQELASAFVDLALKVKGAKMKSVVFQTNDEWTSADPDFDYMHELVDRALNPPPRQPGSGGEEPVVDRAEDACAYNPTGETVEDAIATYGVGGS
ncbi:LCP family protein required for cell wall assembly [Nocardioides thalensis]|uniref:LCP family protein required for cell wall assembly n=1 Tax=Nocardioides thalensis TaxID=1914755 RepID=A0A853C1C5_9ACTN|nr:LCP family protein [Nocardioides thalensis]NYJ00947.1 LCP family protein required for cell wall assembly [Nocardioides thalensis]